LIIYYLNPSTKLIFVNFFLASIKNCTLDNCFNHPIENSSSIFCSYPNKTCDDNRTCISVDMLCNGKNDCLDGSDEGGLCGKLLNIIHCLYNIMYIFLCYISLYFINFYLFNLI